jgi:hypothetical protein
MANMCSKIFQGHVSSHGISVEQNNIERFVNRNLQINYVQTQQLLSGCRIFWGFPLFSEIVLQIYATISFISEVYVELIIFAI